RAVGGRGSKRRIENLLQGARIGINAKHGDIAGIVAGGKQEPPLEIQGHHIYLFLARKRRPGHRREDASKIVSRVDSDALGVSRIGGEYKCGLELSVCWNGAEK